MSAANARCSSASSMALPPYLITTVAPWNRSSHGSASMSVLALPSAMPEVAAVAVAVTSSTPSSRARTPCDRSLVQTVAAASPASRSTATCTARPLRSTLDRSSAGRAAPADPHAVDRDVDLVRLERGRRRADRGEDPAPVGVVAEERGLDQVVAGDRPADLDRVVLAGRAGDLDRDVLRGALGVGEQLRGQVAADGGDRRRSAPPAVGSIPDGAAGQQQHRVVGRHAAVGVDPVERDPGRRPQRLVERRRRRPPRRWSARPASWPAPGASMPAPLAIPPTRPALAVDDGGLGTVSVVMMASAAAAPAVPGEPAGGGVDPGQQLVHRQPLADQTGRADGDVAGADRNRAPARTARPRRARRWRGCPGSRPAPVQALAPPELSTTAAHDAGPQHLLAPQHRRGLDPVAGEDARRGRVRPVVDDERHVRARRAVAFSPAATPAARKPFGAVTVTVRSHRR